MSIDWSAVVKELGSTAIIVAGLAWVAKKGSRHGSLETLKIISGTLSDSSTENSSNFGSTCASKKPVSPDCWRNRQR